MTSMCRLYPLSLVPSDRRTNAATLKGATKHKFVIVITVIRLSIA